MGRLVIFAGEKPNGVALCRGIMHGWDAFQKNTYLVVGDGKRVKFWEHVWCGEVSLREAFPSIYILACDKEASVFYYLRFHEGVVVWDISLRRKVNESPEEALIALLLGVHDIRRIGEGEDEIRWNLSKDGSFHVKFHYQSLCGRGNSSFPWQAIWKTLAPLKVSFIIWCVAQRKILTIYNLIRRRIIIFNWCCMCKRDTGRLIISLFTTRWHGSFGPWQLLGWYSVGFVEKCDGTPKLLGKVLTWERNRSGFGL
ncbi:uncharacterized protein LOC131324709 [Rhododendron vialii]|uniref:uncharacterized protein LOC131324709 n=1 Tax=Rhododendron vialii TaxID=182163 RepID=UPI00265DE470|nr:uncharacterized protein LOC131324709 [Rhododendron vialii]